MENLSKGIKETLPDFQKCLFERHLALEKNVPFLAYWVSRFLIFCRKNELSTDDYNESSVIAFLDMLRADEKILDWQPRQADDALKLYYFHYLGKAGPKLPDATGSDDAPAALEEVIRLIRLRHYSYSTERTYLQWIQKFFSYALTGGKRLPDLTTSDFKDFLSHLAMKQRVSASTQNQAFNAVLFLYRHVLGKETGDLGNILDLFIVFFGAAVYPCDTRVAEGSKILSKRAVHQPVDPAILKEDNAETQRDLPVVLGFLRGTLHFHDGAS